MDSEIYMLHLHCIYLKTLKNSLLLAARNVKCIQHIR